MAKRRPAEVRPIIAGSCRSGDRIARQPDKRHRTQPNLFVSIRVEPSTTRRDPHRATRRKLGGNNSSCSQITRTRSSEPCPKLLTPSRTRQSSLTRLCATPPSDGTARSVTALAPAQRGGSSPLRPACRACRKAASRLAMPVPEAEQGMVAAITSRLGSRYGEPIHEIAFPSQSGPRPLSPYGSRCRDPHRAPRRLRPSGHRRSARSSPAEPAEDVADRDLLSGFGERPVQDRGSLGGRCARALALAVELRMVSAGRPRRTVPCSREAVHVTNLRITSIGV